MHGTACETHTNHTDHQLDTSAHKASDQISANDCVRGHIVDSCLDFGIACSDCNPVFPVAVSAAKANDEDEPFFLQASVISAYETKFFPLFSYH